MYPDKLQIAFGALERWKCEALFKSYQRRKINSLFLHVDHRYIKFMMIKLIFYAKDVRNISSVIFI